MMLLFLPAECILKWLFLNSPFNNKTPINHESASLLGCQRDSPRACSAHPRVRQKYARLENGVEAPRWIITLPSILDIFLARCSSKTNSIMKDPTHPSHSLFQLLPSGRRYRSIRARSARLLNSFFPQAVRAWTQITPPPSETPRKPLPPEPWTISPPPPPSLSKHPPQPYHTKEKLWTFLFFCSLCNSSVLHTGEWACTKPPVVTHSPLCALDTFHTLPCVHNPTKDSAIYVCLHAHALQIILYCSPASCLTHNVSLCTCTVLCEAFV